jgi:carbon storage regulator
MRVGDAAEHSTPFPDGHEAVLYGTAPPREADSFPGDFHAPEGPPETALPRRMSCGLIRRSDGEGVHVMLVLSRQRDESIIIGDNIIITIVDIRGDKVRLGIQAPKEISVHRQEVYDAIQKEAAKSKDQDSAVDSSESENAS